MIFQKYFSIIFCWYHPIILILFYYSFIQFKNSSQSLDRLDGGFRITRRFDPRSPSLKRRFASNHDGMQGQLLLSFLGLVHHLGKRQVVDSFAVEDEGEGARLVEMRSFFFWGGVGNNSGGYGYV